MKFNQFNDIIIALYPKVAIESLSIMTKIYLNLFEKLLLLTKLSDNDSKKLKSKHSEDVIIIVYPRGTIENIFRSVGIIFTSKQNAWKNSKQLRSTHFDDVIIALYHYRLIVNHVKNLHQSLWEIFTSKTSVWKEFKKIDI